MQVVIYDKFQTGRLTQSTVLSKKACCKMPKENKSSIWIRCPVCGSKTRTRVYDNTVLINFPLFCPKCKNEVKIDVVNLKMSISKEPDA